MKHIQNMADFDEVLAYSGLVIVDFFAQWCGPCKKIAPKLEVMETQFPDCKFCKVDVDEAEDVAQKYEISAMPTFLFFKNGVQVDSVIGANVQSVEDAIKKHS